MSTKNIVFNVEYLKNYAGDPKKTPSQLRVWCVCVCVCVLFFCKESQQG